jgi:hypothetical protein
VWLRRLLASKKKDSSTAGSKWQAAFPRHTRNPAKALQRTVRRQLRVFSRGAHSALAGLVSLAAQPS